VFQNYITGDIGALGQIAFGKEYNRFLEKNYLKEKSSIDVRIDSFQTVPYNKDSTILTMGDSFSEQLIMGYQNYLSHLSHYKVVNINIRREDITTHQVDDALALLNNGIIDSAVCKVFILEIVDRYIISYLAEMTIDNTYLHKYPVLRGKKSNDKDDLYKLFQWIRLQLNYNDPIFLYDLKQDCFTHSRYAHTAFIYTDDLNFRYANPVEIETAKQSLVLLNKKFSDKGIKLIFLIAADKYDVYRPFMTDSSLPVDTTTDSLLSDLPDICIINTKPMLQAMVRNGEKDMYMVNDMHWSYKASEAVARRLAHDIDSLGILK